MLGLYLFFSPHGDTFLQSTTSEWIPLSSLIHTLSRVKYAHIIITQSAAFRWVRDNSFIYSAPTVSGWFVFLQFKLLLSSYGTSLQLDHSQCSSIIKLLRFSFIPNSSNLMDISWKNTSINQSITKLFLFHIDRCSVGNKIL